MSISTALQVGVSGLSAQGFKVSKVSDNIANSNTVGYKRTFVDFSTRTSAAGGPRAPEAVSATATKEMKKQGGYEPSNNASDLAISGDGFFIVAKNANETDESNFFLTRAGNFRPDRLGYLKNAAGFFLQGYPTDATGNAGNVDRATFDDLVPIRVETVQLKADPTSNMELVGNLPSEDTGLALPGAPYINYSEFYTPLGDKTKLAFNWQPTTNANEWNLNLSDENGVNYGDVTVTFNDSGPLAGTPASYTGAVSSAVAPASFTVDPATGVITIDVDNGVSTQNIEITIGAPGATTKMTQFSGNYTPSKTIKDGSSLGNIVRTEYGSDGLVTGVFDNGVTEVLYEIPLGDVENEFGLNADDGNVFLLTRESGAFSVTQANNGSTGNIESFTLEQSNVDIAQELTDMIIAQRSYSSNAKVIQTADEMLQETSNIKR
jgi:flagellar hook protein FlgE